jgi:hypothetical protein
MRVLIAIMIALGVLVSPSDASAVDFRTPGKAAYCDYVPVGEVIEGGVPNPKASLQCWTPNDGFWTYMTRASVVKQGYSEQFQGYPPAGVLRFGHKWRVGGFTCNSRRTGLTCKNRHGHGWWLGRYVGYRVF